METTKTTTKTRRFAVVDVVTPIRTLGGPSKVDVGTRYELGRDRYHAVIYKGDLVIGQEWTVPAANFHLEDETTVTTTTKNVTTVRV